MADTIVLCKLDDVPDPGSRGFDPLQAGHDTVFVVRQGQSVYCYRDLCPHYGDTTLPWRKDDYLDPFGEVIVCAAHGAHFEITTGLCILGPCLGDCLPRVPVQINEAGDVLLSVGDVYERGENT